jgi:glycosyltransferase involved in cell wall biosynthesis
MERQPHPSNHNFLTWFHGDPADSDFVPLFERLRPLMPGLERIVTSNTITRDALIAAGIPAGQIALIPIGVDTTLFCPPEANERAAIRQRLGVPAGAFCIGSFQKDGSGWGDGMEPKLIKGPDTFLAVIERLAARHDDLFVLLTGPARGYVRAGLERLGVRYHHDLLDDYAGITAYYHALDCYLITSRAEGGPKGLMESWASGVPVVSTAMGMPADYIEHGANGLLAPVEAVDDLAEAVETLMADADLRARCIASGRRDVRPLDWDVIGGQYLDQLYAPLLERP